MRFLPRADGLAKISVCGVRGGDTIRRRVIALRCW
jgi:hypothetical protein